MLVLFILTKNSLACGDELYDTPVYATMFVDARANIADYNVNNIYHTFDYLSHAKSVLVTTAHYMWVNLVHIITLTTRT